MNKFNPIILAYYLPQYHPFPQNDEWWGKGFTEWTNVGKAKPFFKGHYEPKVPTELGYYDLRMQETREKQVELAKAAGVTGFCYWHYWFGNKRQLLNEIIDDVIATGKPDFPFCFGWANETWKSKCWGAKGRTDKILMEQVYGGERDYREHFEYVLKAFKDSRYVKIDNKPVFVIYKPLLVPADFMPTWDKWAKEEGFDGIYFIARVFEPDEMDKKDAICKQFGHITTERWHDGYRFIHPLYKIYVRLMSRFFYKLRAVQRYKDVMNYLCNPEEDSREEFIPSLIPNWDHSPRSGARASILHDCKPEYFYQHAMQVFDIVKKKENQIVFLKSWNEWGEGNYMEPCIKYGRGYIEALAKAIKDTKDK
jgi:hypothetical protein